MKETKLFLKFFTGFLTLALLFGSLSSFTSNSSSIAEDHNLMAEEVLDLNISVAATTSHFSFMDYEADCETMASMRSIACSS